MEATLLLSIPVGAFIVPMVLAWFAGAARSFVGTGLLWAIWAVFTAGHIFGMQTSSNLDELAHFMAIIGISAPAFVGLALGGMFGWPSERKTKNA